MADQDSPDASENRRTFNIETFAKLERHMLMMLEFKINMPTPLDFALFYAHRAYDHEAAQALVQ